jgi:hypothetical protein
MKKIATLFFLMALTVIVFAQRTYKPGDFIQKSLFGINDLRDVDTTLLIPFTFSDGSTCSDGFTIYSSQGGGWVSGTNGYGDLEKLQMYDLGAYWEGAITDAPRVDSIYVWFGAKNVGPDPGNVEAVVYDGDESIGPDNLLGTSEPINMIDIDTSSSSVFTGFGFDPDVDVENKMFAGIRMSTNTGDTVGIVTTVDPCAEFTGFSWEKWSDGSFHFFNETGNWELDLDLAIFPLVVTGGEIGIQTTGDLALNAASPNPASDNITLNYLVKRFTNISINIYDVAGKLLNTIDNGDMNAGINKQIIDVSDLENGLYLYEIISSTGKVNGNFIVAGR